MPTWVSQRDIGFEGFEPKPRFETNSLVIAEAARREADRDPTATAHF